METNNINKAGSMSEDIHNQDNTEIPSSGDQSGTIFSIFRQVKENEKLMNSLRITLRSLVAVLVVLFVFVFMIYIVPGFQELSPGRKTKFSNDQEMKNDQNYKKQASALTREIQRLSKRYASYTSGQSYIVINTTYNRFFLYKNKKLIREGTCSTGSYKRLQTAEGRSWTFKTPRGKFEIQGKRTNPSWHKPDWAFIEEGLPVPPKDSPLRWEPYVLGDYALDLGDSYMIHGTIYKRQLGMPVTHGCVRLNDEDLEAVFRTLNIGSKVYIF
jgi:lipoprotein-anchoring transpeptidase ErfK/SrfK